MSDYEDKARQDGWVPQDEWRGDPEKWVDAEKFVKKGEEINGILRSKVEKLESAIEQQRQTFQEFKSFSEKALEKERREAQVKIKQLESERAEAISEGDGQRFTKLDNEIQELRKESSKEPSRPADVNALADQWQSKNEWYGTDDDLTIYADGVAQRVINEGFTGQAYFNELTRRVKEKYPDRFENPKRAQPSNVEEPGVSKDSSSNGRSWSDLPDEAKTAFKRFQQQMPDYTKEQYLAAYDWE